LAAGLGEVEDKAKEKGTSQFCVITEVYLAKGEQTDDPLCELVGKMAFEEAGEEKPVVHCADAITEKMRKKGEEKGIVGKGKAGEELAKKAEAEKVEVKERKAKAAGAKAAAEAEVESAGWRAIYVRAYPYMVTLIAIALSIISSVFLLSGRD